MTSVMHDVDAVAERVKQHLPHLNMHHVTFLDVIVMLCDELDERLDKLESKIDYGRS